MKRQITVINPKKRVVQGNPLLELSYSIDQLPSRVVRVIISQIDDQRDKNFPQFVFSKNELYKALSIEKYKDKHQVLKSAFRHLQQRIIEFETGEGEDEAEIMTSWVLKSRVWKYKDRVDIWIDGDLAPFLLDLKTRFYDSGQTFSKYRLEEVLSLRGEYTIRFFEWFNEYRWKSGKSKAGKWYVPEISLEEIRRRLGHLDEKGNIIKLARWHDFRRFVIQPTVEEISEKSDFTVDWEVGSKKGKKILGIVFHCTPKDKKREKLLMYEGTASKDDLVEGLAKKEFDSLPWRNDNENNN